MSHNSDSGYFYYYHQRGALLLAEILCTDWLRSYHDGWWCFASSLMPKRHSSRYPNSLLVAFLAYLCISSAPLWLSLTAGLVPPATVNFPLRQSGALEVWDSHEDTVKGGQAQKQSIEGVPHYDLNQWEHSISNISINESAPLCC